MGIRVEKRMYRLTGITPLLGSQPPSQTVRTQFLLSKLGPDKAGAVEEESALQPDYEERGLTVFLRDERNHDYLYLMDFTLKGYFKAALGAMREQLGVAQAAKKTDLLVFPSPRRMYLLRDGAPIVEEDDLYERSIRTKTMQGERVALMASEQVYDPWAIEFELTLVPNLGSGKSNAIDWATVEDALDYGALLGLAQFRSGGYGRFTWERIERFTPGVYGR